MSGLELEVLSSVPALLALGDEWDELFDRSTFAHPYLSRAWAESWWRHYGGKLGPTSLAGASQLNVVAIRENNELVALAPWLRFRLGVGKAALTTIVGIGQETADLGGVLLGKDPSRYSKALLDYLSGEFDRRTVLNCTRLAPTDPWLAALKGFATETGMWLRPAMTEAYPVLDLRLSDDPSRDVRRLLKRNDVRRRWRRLEESNRTLFAYHRPSTTPEDLTTFFRLHDQRWEEKGGVPDALFGTQTGRQMLSEASLALNEAGILRVSIVTSGDEAVAARYGFEHRGIYYGLKSGWNPDYYKFGPGHLIVGKILEELVQRPSLVFEFMRGEGEHKSAWSNREDQVSYWLAGQSTRGASWRDRGVWAALALRTRYRARQ